MTNDELRNSIYFIIKKSRAVRLRHSGLVSSVTTTAESDIHNSTIQNCLLLFDILVRLFKNRSNTAAIQLSGSSIEHLVALWTKDFSQKITLLCE